MAALRPLVAGNWKMNGLKASLSEIEAMVEAVGKGAAGRADCAICPPFTLIAAAVALCSGKGGLRIGGQDCHTAASGPFTGDISAEMLKDAGAELVIVGHSERRSTHRETDDLVRAKAEAAGRAGLPAIICIGETRAERDGGETLRVIGRQVDESLPPKSTGEAITIAYEPIWAIGTGAVPSTENIAEVHGFIRRRLSTLLGPEGEKVRILYGGSVKPSNARDIVAIPEVDGLLVGGASLTAAEFLGILAAYG